MERPYTGLTAQVKLNGELIGYLNSVELSLEKDVIEIVQFGSTYKEKVPAIKNWTASSEGTVAFAAGESQHKLYQAFESGELVQLTIMLDTVSYFEGDALITSLSISGGPEDALSLSVEFEGSGGVTLTLPITYLVTISSGVGGTTTPSGTVRVVKDADLVITCVPAAGKVSEKYFLDDNAVGVAITANTFTLEDVAEDHSVAITFKDIV